MTQDQGSCYHCGLPVPSGTHFAVDIRGSARTMCCAGCEAIAGAIVANGLDDYYRHRDALPESPREAIPQALQDLGVFDHPSVQQGFVHPVGEHEREATLILEGITCAACVWLNESHLARQPGVRAVDVNYATRRARVRWDMRDTKLSTILAAIVAIGYRAHPYDPARSELLARQERKEALWRLFVAGFGMMQVMMYAVPVYLADVGTMSADIELLMRWASLILTLPVVLYSAAPFFRSAWRDLGLRRIGMDVPVALGVGAAFLASLWATVRGHGQVYFDSVTMFVFFLLGGRYLEMMARHRAVRGMEALARAAPTLAARLRAFPALETDSVAAAELIAGDLVLVKPGESFPADGQVVDGSGSVDESLLSGESRPIPKAPGDAVTGGAVNGVNPLVMRVERVGEETRLASIRRLMDRAAAEKPRLVQLADRIAARFVMAVLLLALLTAGIWYVHDAGRMLEVFVTVLVVSCPCALSLATPAALTVATGTLATQGLLTARGHAIEALARVNRMLFDKTGTLTRGRMGIVEIVSGGRDSVQDLHRLAAAIEQSSSHPIAMALRAGVDVAKLPCASLARVEAGQGVEAEVAGIRYRLGRPDYCRMLHGLDVDEQIHAWEARGETVVALADARGWRGYFRLADTLREGAVEMVRSLEHAGIGLGVLSGDSSATVRSVADALGIEFARGDLSADQKHAYLKACLASGDVAAMVGDGVNDAPVLALAQVSIAMGEGTDLARTQGDMVLLGQSLEPIAAGVLVARRTLRIVRQNLIWSFGYNILAIPLAMAGWVTPWMAGIGMSASSLLVVLNALRLQPRKN
ncbi:MAG: cadmium-translocating P-type ATPase [Proteobacteria bacterium]|nr:cadmium-translocating P-type ATPase [Pseudomonadota bacterium]HQR03453.1 heavy metal translocating P-type ATPase [Rhodocyclaceae bacterium]